MKLTLNVWRQTGPSTPGKMVRYEMPNVNADMSFLEMLDVLNETLIAKGEEPVTFEHDCREGICGSCGFMINGKAHGGFPKTTVCQLHMRHYKDGDELYLEPWRATAFPILKDPAVPKQPMRAWRVDYKTEPPVLGKLYPLFVPAIGPDGNELGGVRMPEVAVPLAAYRGWNYVSAPNAPKGYVLDMVGSTLPFAAKSILDKYQSKSNYQSLVRAKANEMVKDRLLLERDVEAVVNRAGQAWDWLLSSK